MRTVFALVLALAAHRASALIVARSAASSCNSIAKAISPSSAVFYPGSAGFDADISHFVNSSSEVSTCSVEPGTSDDIVKILAILAKDKTPFGLKGGGHSFHAGFSSTLGVQIAMSRFNTIDYDATKGQVTVGAGLRWDPVYITLAQYGVNVVGGRITGVGVAGFLLGGGYSLLSNERGVAVDSVLGFEVVTPTGNVVNATATTNPDLFWALKGGYNNFGIVTKFVLKTYPQTSVWGGRRVIADANSEAVINATVKFVNTVTDPKAAILVTWLWVNNVTYAVPALFYNAPNKPAGIFDDFLSIPAVQETLGTRTFVQQFQSVPDQAEVRTAHDSIPIIHYSAPLLRQYRNQTIFWGQKLSALDGGFHSTIAAEPFIPNFLNTGATSAYPSTRSLPFTPMSFDFGWVNPAFDAQMADGLQQASAAVRATAIQQGEPVDKGTPYGNYAYKGHTSAEIFGSSLPRLKTIKAKYDPQNVMALTGGWKV